ncbi:MAG: hypothetical protein AAB320_00915 [Elusimicrobiota bacterium]
MANTLVDRLQATADGGPNAGPSLFDGTSSRGDASTMPTAAPQTMAYRHELGAPRATRVNHMHKPGERPDGRVVPRGRSSLERGYAWTMHPATELLDSDNAGLKIAGFILGVVLVIPAVILAVLNNIASNSRLTKGTSWHRHD